MMKFPLNKAITFFARVVGMNGKVRELRAAFDLLATYTIIPYKDALQLGYEPEWISQWSKMINWMEMVTISGIVRAPLIPLFEVRLGELVARNVYALAHDLPEEVGIEALLGISFLKNFNVTLDYEKGILTIE